MSASNDDWSIAGMSGAWMMMQTDQNKTPHFIRPHAATPSHPNQLPIPYVYYGIHTPNKQVMSTLVKIKRSYQAFMIRELPGMMSASERGEGVMERQA